MAVPKKRTSKAKKRTRRAGNNNLSAPSYQTCPSCYAPKRAHRACTSCGHYKDEQVIEVWEY